MAHVYAKVLHRCAEEKDSSAWEELVRRFGPRLLGAVRGALRRAGQPVDEEAARDLVQEVYCRLLERDAGTLRRFRGASDGEAIAYLGRVAERVVLDHLRAAWTAKRGSIHLRRLEFSDLPPEALIDPAASAEDRFHARQLRACFLRQCGEVLGDAPQRNFWVIRKAVVEGWTSREISRALDGELAPSSVDSLLYRLRQRLAASGMSLPRRHARAAEL